MDQHCHPLDRPRADVSPLLLRACFTEGREKELLTDHVPHSAAYRLALRRLATALDCEPTERAVLACRQRSDPEAYLRLLMERTGTGLLLLDHGFAGPEAMSPEEHRRLVPVAQREVIRLETLAESLLMECSSPRAWLEAVKDRLREAAGAGAVGVKTIVAYRASLYLREHRPSLVAASFFDLRRSGTRRLVGDPLCHTLVRVAAEECVALGLPLQVHCGLGDSDEDLAQSSPLGLRPLLVDPRLGGLRVVLLHCYPFHREAAYLCSVHEGVHMDLSLAVPLAALDGARAFREALGLCPWSKLLYATDASRLPEVYLVAAQLQREALAAALGELVEVGALSASEAVAAGREVLAGNARRLYRL